MKKSDSLEDKYKSYLKNRKHNKTQAVSFEE